MQYLKFKMLNMGAVEPMTIYAEGSLQATYIFLVLFSEVDIIC